MGAEGNAPSTTNLHIQPMAPKKKAAAAAAAPEPAPVEDDVSMGDAPAAAEVGAAQEDDTVSVFDEEQRIRILPGSSDTAASFEFKKEDHTLGNALRYIIMKKILRLLNSSSVRSIDEHPHPDIRRYNSSRRIR